MEQTVRVFVRSFGCKSNKIAPRWGVLICNYGVILFLHNYPPQHFDDTSPVLRRQLDLGQLSIPLTAMREAMKNLNIMFAMLFI